jgi:hypothetical protein
MFVDNSFGIPPSALLRFRARWPGGAVERHEYPAATAVAYADQLRDLGLTIGWKPFEPPAAPTAAKPTRAEHKAARRLALTAAVGH